MSCSSSVERLRWSVRHRWLAISLQSMLLLTIGLSGMDRSHAGVSVRWQDGGGSVVDQQVMTVLADSRILSDFVSMIDENFELAPALSIVLGASEGPSMNRETRVLNLPNDYLAHVIVTQSELVEDRDEALQRALDVVEYTLYLLFGHALLGVDSAAALGTDDADKRAEALSTWVMLSHWPNGGEQWLADVSAFADASQKLDGPQSDFWHEHSLYRLRQEQIYCWILGKDPAAHAKLLPAVQITEARQEECVASWSALNDNVLKTLDTVLKSDAPLRQQ